MIRASILAAVLLLATGGPSTQSAATAADLDSLLAPVALYPDQLLGPMLVCAGNPGKVAALSEWMRSHESVKGSDLQAAAAQAGFDDSYVALILFPEVVNWMASQSAWMSKVGAAFASDRSAVFASIQRLRGKAKAAGTLKSTPQQSVETRTTPGGDQVIVIEPANSQIVYVPQYNAQTVYTQPSSTTVVVQQSSSSSDAALAGVIGFTAGVAIGAMWDNNYYYGPYGYRGGYMYNDAWDDWYDHREDAREDWADHREDIVEERGERAGNAQEQRTDRQQNRQENRPETQAQREQRRTEASTRAESARSAQAQGTSPSAASASTARSTAESRGYSGSGTRTTGERSGTKSDAFSGYSSGKGERSASSRGQRSRSSSRSGGGSRRR